jgi:hypothetical protein
VCRCLRMRLLHVFSFLLLLGSVSPESRSLNAEMLRTGFDKKSGAGRQTYFPVNVEHDRASSLVLRGAEVWEGLHTCFSLVDMGEVLPLSPRWQGSEMSSCLTL